MTSKLTSGSRRIAIQLSVSDINWIINELPEKFVPQLFGNSNKKAEQKILPTANKIEVRLRILPELVEQSRNIFWDVSQTLTPDAQEDSNARILFVKLDNLDKIKNWISDNRKSIEILQPVELQKEFSEVIRNEN